MSVTVAMQKRLRVCFVTVEFHGLFKNGGIGTANTALAVALAANGYDITVAIASSDESGPRLKVGDFAELKTYWAARGITLDYVRPHPHIGGSFDDPRTASYCILLYLQSGDFDVVLFNDNGGQGYYSLLAKHTGVFARPPLMCVVAHGPIDWVHELNALEYYSRMPVVMSYLERRSAALADVLVSPSEYLLDWMVNRGWIPHGRGRVLQNLLGLEEMQPTPRADRGPEPINEIVFFGRQETRKGLSLFCDALEMLDRTSDLRSRRVTFLGKFGRIGALHSGVYVVERARRWRATVRVLAVYDQSEALSYLRRPGMLAVIPSRAENSPCVVAECLQLGLPFLATNTGGTAELVAPEDRDLCLFDPEPGALARRLDEALRIGHRPARPAFSQADALAQWLRLLDISSPAPVVSSADTEQDCSAFAPEAAQGAPRSVSVCLFWSKSKRFQACFDSLRQQTHGPLEIIVAVDAKEAGERGRLPMAQYAGVTVVSGNFSGPGAARNAAVRRLRGDYVLFVDEAAATLLPEALAVLMAAAGRTGADIVTGFRELDAGQKLPKPGARAWELPIGACTELGAIENCFGQGVLLVKASFFADHPGFDEECAGPILDWLFLAEAALSGAMLEVVPVPVVRLSDHHSAIDDGERTVEDHRRILQLYRKAPIESISRLAEFNLQVNAQNARKMHSALEGVSKPARDLALRLASLEPSSQEACRLFAQYCCERRALDLALDFALHNDVTFLPETVTAMSRAGESDALNVIRSRHFDVIHRVNLSEEVFARARPFYRLRREDLRRSADGGLQYNVEPGDSIVKISAACPPGALAVQLAATAESVPVLKLAAVKCRSWSRPVLSDTGIVSDGSVWWSGWGESTAGAEIRLSIELASPCGELYDLYLIVRRAEAEPCAQACVTWQAITAQVCLTGDVTPSAIETAIEATPLPPDFLIGGELLTDVSKVAFPVFVPGVRTLLHPLAGRLSLVRVPSVLPRGSRGVRCIVSVEHEKAHPIEFGVWARPTAAPAASASELGEAENFSGWLRVDVPLKKCAFTLLASEPARTPMDLYLATRVVGASDAYFCHAYWHEFAILEEVSQHPAAQRSRQATPDRISRIPGESVKRSRWARSPSAAAPSRAIRNCYLLCAGARTGSNLLASALRRTGICGLPFEYFNTDLMNDDAILKELGLSAGPVDVEALAARLEAILRGGTTPNGVFGATVHWWDLDRLRAAVGKSRACEIPPLGSAPDGLRAFFPGLRYVWLRRENKVAQGISHYIATRTGAWHRWVRDLPTRQGQVPEVVYDFAAIKDFVTTAEAEDAGWRGFLADSSSITLSLTYEDLAADYRGTVTRVLTFLDVAAGGVEIPPPAFHRQADARSVEWERRYREEERKLSLDEVRTG